MNNILQAAKENLVFLCTCLGIFAALFLLALLAQRILCKHRRRLSGARTISFVAVFGAIAAVLVLIEIPLFFAPSFYKIDLSEIPVLICTFYLGPAAGVACELIKVLVKLLIKGTTTAFVGDFANFFVGCSLVLPASVVYHCKKTKKSAVLGLITGTLVMTVFGSFFNAVYLLPKFAQLYGLPLETIVGMGTAVNPAISNVTTLVAFAVVPFNLLKGAVVSVLTLLLYKRVERLFRR